LHTNIRTYPQKRKAESTEQRLEIREVEKANKIKREERRRVKE